MSDTLAERTFVLGLDGIPWSLLTRWAADGSLPNFARLVEEGTTGPLESTMPPTTALAWPSIATGVRPDKSGIYSFRRLTEEHTHEIYTSADIRQPSLWNVLSPAVVANVPMTYPAQEIDGTIVTGMMTPEIGDGFTHPPALREHIESHIPDYRIGLDWSQYYDRTEQFLEEFDTLLSARRALMRELMDIDEWELFFFVYTEPDRLQHLIWDEETLLAHYTDLDDILGEVIEYVTERNANLFVVSDHGFGPVSKFVHVNTVLENAGYLARESGSSVRTLMGGMGVNKDNVRSVLQAANLEQRLLKTLPEGLISRAATNIPGDHKLFDVDFSETEVFVYSSGNVYVNDSERFTNGIVDPNDRVSLKRAVAELFEGVTDPETGETVLTVHDGDDLFPTDPDSPDLIVRAVDGYEESTKLDRTVITSSGGKAAGHRSEGVFLSWGPDIAHGTVTGATVYDVAPTVLHSLLKPVPDRADGSVLDIFEPGSAPARTEPRQQRYETKTARRAPDGEFDEVETRLRGLGYID